MNKWILIFLFLLPATTFANENRLSLHLSCDSKSECTEVPFEGKTLSIRKAPEMTLDTGNIREMNEGKDEYGQPSLTIRLDDSAASTFGEITAKNITKKLVIVLDGKALMAPMIRQKIPGGTLTITLGVGETHKFWADIPWMQEKIMHQKHADQNANSKNTIIYVVGGLVIFSGALRYGFKAGEKK